MIRRRSLLANTTPERVAGDGRTVRVRLVAWDTPSQVTDDQGRTWYQESFKRGGLQVPPDVTLIPATVNHGGETIGRLITIDDQPDGLYGDIRVSATRAGDDQLALIDDGLLSVSVEFDDHAGKAAHGSTVERDDAVVRAIAFTTVPQHSSAAVLGRRSHQETTPMSDDPNLPDPVDPPETPPAPLTVVPAPEHQRSHAATRPDPTPPRAAAAPVHTRYRSLGEFVNEAAHGRIPLEERDRFYRALSAATTADIAGLMQIQWISDVIDLIRPSMPTVNAFAQRPLPDKGLSISRPIVTQRPTIGKQTTQNAIVGSGGITSQKVTVGTATWTVDTYGGGQEMSIQTMLRSEPAYLDQVMRLYAVEMVRKLETDVVAAVLAAAATVNTTIIELSNTATAYQDAFIDAADTVMGAIDRLPELAVINRKMWVLLAKALDSSGRPLFPGVSLFNPQGTMSITSTDGEVRGLRWFVAPKMDNTVANAVVGVPEAFETMVGPIQTLQNDVPETLTHQHAVFQFAAFGKVDASGLVRITNAV